jgi:DNA-binding NtrC family response regulator
MGRSDAVLALRERLDELAAKAAPVLLIGPPGTGRQSVARDLHARSPRVGAPFVSVSGDAGLDETLLESQMFGHRRGAFPGATHDRPGACRLASGGTLFIQRLDHLPQRLQSRLVDVLRSGRCLAVGAAQAVETDFRLVASAIQDIEDLARAGRFRDDLRALLGPGTLRIPALRERPEDIAFLAEAYSAEEAERLGVAGRRITHDCFATLSRHSWPGNVRELRQAIRHAFAATLSDVIRPDDLPASVRGGARVREARDPDELPTLAEAEADLVALALEDSRGNKTLAARRLGIDRKRLYRKIRRYSLLLPGEEESVDDVDDTD